MKVKVSIEELQRHSLASIEVWDGKKLEYLILEATPLEEVKECSPHVFNNIDMNPECLKCGSPKQKDWYEDAVGKKLSKHSPKQKEDCCQGKWVHSKDCPVLKQIKQKQEVELPEMPEELPYVSYEKEPLQAVIENNRKTINQIIKYLKQ